MYHGAHGAFRGRAGVAGLVRACRHVGSRGGRARGIAHGRPTTGAHDLGSDAVLGLGAGEQDRAGRAVLGRHLVDNQSSHGHAGDR